MGMANTAKISPPPTSGTNRGFCHELSAHHVLKYVLKMKKKKLYFG
jgi:hypothetical protein